MSYCLLIPTSETHFDVIFIDSYCWGNRGLASHLNSCLLQNQSVLVLPISGNDPDSFYQDLIYQESISCKSISYRDFYADPSTYLYYLSSLVSENLYLHIKPWCVLSVVISKLISASCKCLLDLTDHSFSLGFDSVDAIYTWRSWGLNLLSSSLRSTRQCKNIYLIPLSPPSSVSKDSGEIDFFDKCNTNIICGVN